MQDLGTFGGPRSLANAINNSGQVVGYAWNKSLQEYAFLYSGGTMQDLGTLPGYTYASDALDINNSGQVVGYSESNGGAAHYFLLSGGTMQDLNNLIATSSGWTLYSVNAINDEGQIVGDGLDPSGHDGAFLYSDGMMEDLNNLISPSSDWTLDDATAINDNGQIVGWGVGPNGENGFLLTPTPEPSSLILLAAGAFSVLGYGWRRRQRAARTSVSVENGAQATLSFPSRLPEAMRRAA